MKAFIAILAVLGAVPAFASPAVPTRTAQIVDRTTGGPTATQCGSHAYSAKDISAAYTNGINQSGAGTTIPAKKPKSGSARTYPTTFNNYEKISLPGCPGQTAPFIEFPIKRDGTAFLAGDDQGPDRVIYKDIGGSYEFCGVDTHEGQKGNAVVACT